MEEINWAEIKRRLNQSKFRSKFKLSGMDLTYAREKSADILKEHTYDFISTRLASAEPKNDGRQTPWKGHPVFVAQHATGTCCRGCLRKWHDIAPGKSLENDEIDYIVTVIMAWIQDELSKR